MRRHLLSGPMRLCIGLVLTVGALLWARPASAVPAFARRLGVNCSYCHQPLFARLNKTGWEFRRLGFRLPKEMNEKLLPGVGKEGDNVTRYDFADAISLGFRLRFDDISTQGVKRFDSGYLSESNLYLAAPYGKNFGFEVELGLFGQNPSVKTEGAIKQYETSDSSVDFGGGHVRAYSGSPDRFFSLKVGQMSPWDAYGANDRAISAGAPLMFGTRVDKFATSSSKRGLDVGYTAGDNHLSLVATEGVNSSGSGTNSRTGNNFDYALQYIRWIGNAGSSVQLFDYVGNTPVDATGTFYDRFNHLFLMGNYRQPLNPGHAIDFVAGYLTGSHTKWVPGTTPTTNGHFGIDSWFAESYYEVTNRFVPYIRYENFHSDELSKGAAWPGNPVPNTHQFTLGVADNPAQNLRLNLEYVHTVPNPGATTDLIRAQAWFFF